MMFPVRFALAFWCIAEVLAFVLVAEWIGFGDAVLATLLTSALGFILLKRQGAATLAKLRMGVSGRRETGVLPDALAVTGALALVLPGFLSDLLGAALSIKPIRRRAADWIGARGWRVLGQSVRPVSPTRGETVRDDKMRGDTVRADTVIDLEPAEWRSTDAPPVRGRQP